MLLIYHENKAKCSVLLFRPTQNKETLEKVGTFATSIILADLAKATGIDFSVGYESEIVRYCEQSMQGRSLSYTCRQMCKRY